MILIDSNILIYSAKDEYKYLRKLFKQNDVFVSSISKLEVLGYHGLVEKDRVYFDAVFKVVKILPIDSIIIEQAILVRREHNISVGDAIIAATSLFYNYSLYTRNVSDFKPLGHKIEIINPIK